MYCPVCGQANADESRFCRNCGSALPGGDVVAKTVQAASSPVVSTTRLPGVSPVAGADSQSVVAAVQAGAVQNPSPMLTSAPIQQGVISNQGQQTSFDVNTALEQAAENAEAYKSLVLQFEALIQQRRSGAISDDLFRGAWQNLAVSHPNGERAGAEALRSLARQLLESRNAGTMSPAVCATECSWISANFPGGELVVCEAEIADLEQRYARNQVSHDVYSIRKGELENKRQRIQSNGTAQATPVNPADTGSIGYGFLGFFVPIVGLVLYLLWKDERPRSAHNAGVGALASVVTNVVLVIVYFIVIAVWTASLTQGLTRYH